MEVEKEEQRGWVLFFVWGVRVVEVGSAEV